MKTLAFLAGMAVIPALVPIKKGLSEGARLWSEVCSYVGSIQEDIELAIRLNP